MSRGFLKIEDSIKAPVLGHLDFRESFKFEVDASREGLCAVLSQQQDGRKKGDCLRQSDTEDNGEGSEKLLLPQAGAPRSPMGSYQKVPELPPGSSF